MRIALAQLNYVIGDFEGNLAKITNAIRESRRQKADLVVFAELSLCGYPPRDFLEFDDFINRCGLAIEKIAAECIGIAAIIGAPARNPDLKGKDLFNAAWLLADGEVKGTAFKTLLPNYDIFDEYRYFEPNRQFNVLEYNGIKIALTICEDIWNIGPDPLYVATPMDEMIGLKPDLIINIAASPFNYDQENERGEVLAKNAGRYGLPLVYVNHVGAQTELLFDGLSRVLDASGDVAAMLPAFEEGLEFVDFKFVEGKLTPEPVVHPSHQTSSKTGLIHDALVMGIGDYFRKMGFKKAILGLSGGIDSAVTLALAARALGPENVMAVLLPSEFSSQHSVDDARQLAENLGVRYELIGIRKGYDSVLETLQPYFKGLPFNVTEENIQARLRAVILMAMANKFGYILLNTSNKSEAAVGYGTLYGDMCGGLSVLGDVYKTEVYDLAGYINAEKEIIPLNSITKPPSAELRPGQKDSDSLPDYSILDKILYQYIEKRIGPLEIIAMGFDEAIVRRVLKMVNTNEWKRYQTAPILRVSPKAFGSGRRMPIVGKYLS
ncbi:MAG TPA: NAD+ synthase [Bacteroidales bacterium]|nr:NAD+ synthase [Bacteroidales bacterium]HPT01355.1 NAD+ synthase [Bacteroidales bacterium]